LIETSTTAHISSIHTGTCYMLLPAADAADARFVPTHRPFHVITIGAPVPPYTVTGYPLGPPFRSCFQACFLDQTSALLTYPDSPSSLSLSSAALWILSSQRSTRARHATYFTVSLARSLNTHRWRWPSCTPYSRRFLPRPHRHRRSLPCHRVLWEGL
jgi:hypothetical protein